MKKSFIKRLVALALVVITLLSISAVAMAATLTWSDHYGPGILYSSTQGDVNAYVRNLQYDLREILDLDPEDFKVDGKYGTKTKDAVKYFQQYMNINYSYDLDVDGVAGPETKAALYHLSKCSGDHPEDK